MRTRILLATLLAIGAVVHTAEGGAPARVPSAVVGSETDYTVTGGDSIWSITGRFTMNRALFDARNPLPDPDRLQPGMRLSISDRHITPRHGSDGIVIDLAGRTLYWFVHGDLRARFPVGIGRTDWATPVGRYRIVGRREDPIWHVPPSIQEEMRARGEPVVAVVGPGPDNPLGKYWLQLSAPGYGLHGTNAPASIGKYVTHGCLRFLPEHIAELYREAPDGTLVEVVDEPVKVARDGAGRVYLEVHRDVYRARSAGTADVHALITTAGLAPAVDWARVDEVAARAWGAPEDITATTPGSPAEALNVTPAADQRPE